MKLLLLLATFIALMATPVYALHPEKCFKVLTGDSMLRKYDFPGYLPSSEYMTKKYGTTYGTVQYSLQSSTMSIDPTVSTNRWVSSSQFTSSWGGCDYFSFFRAMKDEYIAKNKEQIHQEIAMGRGDHLRTYFFYSGCNSGAYDVFRAHLQENYESIDSFQGEGAPVYRARLDNVLNVHSDLSSACPYTT